jgi:beta-glucosidase
VPVRSLAGVTRIHLNGGERRTITFTLDPRQMSVVLDDGKRVALPSDFAISIGGEQPGFTGRADASSTSTVSGKFRTTGKTIELPQ